MLHAGLMHQITFVAHNKHMNKKPIRLIAIIGILLFITLLVGLIGRLKPSEGFYLVTIEPKEDIANGYFSIQPITLTFSQAVNKDAFTIQTSPKTEVLLTIPPDKPNVVIINPNPIWQNGTTTIIIPATVTSVDKKPLEKPITYAIKVNGLPKNPDVEEHYGSEPLTRWVEEKLPYMGRYVRISYAPERDTIVAIIDNLNRAAGEKEFDDLLAKAGLKRSSIPKLDIQYN